MRKALVIGIDNYPDASLEGCVNDAISISRILEKNGDGSPNFDVKLITNAVYRKFWKIYSLPLRLLF